MRRIFSQFKKPELGFWWLILIALIAGIVVLCLVWWSPEKLNLIRGTNTWSVWLGASAGGSIFLAIGALLLFFGAREEGKQSFRHALKSIPGDDLKESAKTIISPLKPSAELSAQIRNHLRRRYGFFWRRKVRLLLVTGDEASIEKLVPGLRTSQWLEGDRTVLIYGGSLSSDIDTEKYAALRKLRRGRPLDTDAEKVAAASCRKHASGQFIDGLA